MVLLATEALLLRRGERELLRVASLELREGWRLGLVGANGSGKSTLLSVLAGRSSPSEGRVVRPPGILVHVLEQATDVAGGTLWDLARREAGSLIELERELERLRRRAAEQVDDATGLRYAEALSLFDRRGGFTLDARLRAGLTRVGVPEPLWQRSADDASGGERQRARLVGALCAGSDVLLLDEPSNHLDLRGRDWLAESIGAHRGAVVLASHDRSLLDRVCTHVARIAAGRLVVRRGGYARAASAEADLARAAERAAAARAKRAAELERMAAELARFSHRGAQVRRRRAERERAALAAATTAAQATAAAQPAEGGGSGRWGRAVGRDRRGGLLLHAQHLRAQGVLDDAGFELAAGQRVALLGPSGSGKSTLLELIAGTRASDDPRSLLDWREGTSLLYLDQRWRGLRPESSPMASLETWVTTARGSGALAAAGLPRPAWDRPATSLSGGELARASLALLDVREADVLLLDEPTNDLDLPGIEALEARLGSSDAAIVLASHDAALIGALEAEAWSIESGELIRYRGGIDGYRRGARRVELGLDAHWGMPATAPSAASPVSAALPADGEAVIDAERAAAEAALEDPTRWSERGRQRWRERREAAEAALLGAWEARSPPPAPRFRVREAGLAVLADRDGDGLRVELEAGPWLHARRVGDIAHLVPDDDPKRCILPWAWRALCHGAARLALYLLPVRAVQVASTESLDGGPFERLTEPWWVARREALERSEGWLRRPTAPGLPRRRHRRRRRRG